MLVTYEPFKDSKMIKFQDIRDKYNDIVKLQREEREVLQSVAGLIVQNFSDSLGLEQSYWKHPSDGQTEEYVFITAMKDGESVKAVLNELKPDEHGCLLFSVGLTVDKSPISFPKMHVFTSLSLRREEGGFTLTVGEGMFETTLSEKPTGAELAPVSEAIKRSVLKCLDSYTPARH